MPLGRTSLLRNFNPSVKSILMPAAPSEDSAINQRLRYRPRAEPGLEARWASIRAGDSAALSQAITLLESSRPQDRLLAADLVARADALSGEHSFRLGISGSPGVGKSTFIEVFGQALLDRGHRLAVLAIDPSSSLSGGSILGDKTRMAELAKREAAFIRPSPSGGFLGGVNRMTRESMLLCEAAGYDYLMVETVGVGQSELAVHGMTDAFLLLAQPGAGDELQGIKRGVLELADLIVVNKVDRLPEAAKQTAVQLQQALHLAPARADQWTPLVQTAAALTGEHIDTILTSVEEYRQHLLTNTYFTQGRERQQQQWLLELLRTEILGDLESSAMFQEAARQPVSHEQGLYHKARQLLRQFYHDQIKDQTV